jgi:serine/threonine protein kinase
MDSIYIIMEYIKGISLDKLLANRGRIEENTVIEWAIYICDVLSYLHEVKPSPIIHRD